MNELLEGYHETNIKNVSSILTNNFLPSDSRQRSHWLGRGVYLYEDLYYALEWAILNDKNEIEINTYDKLCEHCGIFLVRINTKECNVLDISSPVGYAIFSKMKELIKNSYSPSIYTRIMENGDANIIRALEKIEEKHGKRYLSYYDVICAMYPKNIYKKKKNSPSDFYVGMQKQICIKNLSAIESYESLQLTENKKIEEIFNLIMENRRNIKDDK